MGSKHMKAAAAAALLAAAAVAGLTGPGALAEDAAKKPGATPAVSTQAETAGAANALSDQEKAEGWTLLFDGTSADQFRNYGKDAVSDKWQVKDGALTLTGGGGGDIITREQYDSFDLTLDYNISDKGNSGLMFYVQEVKGKPPYDSGPEVQIQDNKGGDPQKAGWLYQLYPPPTDEKTGKPVDATKPPGEWNTLRLRLDGPKGTIWMNGVKYSEWEVGSEDWNQRLAKSKFAKWANFAKAKKGHICLQDHGNLVSFRNIKIRKLDGDPATADK